MNQEFIPHKQALELKELGFDEKYLAWYSFTGVLYLADVYVSNLNDKPYMAVAAPLYQQAFRWFRDKKLCDGSVCRHGEADGGYSYRWDIVHEYGVYEERHFKQGYKTYEEAELACLKKLIEIVKNK